MSKPSILLINRVFPPERGATGRMMQDLASTLSKNGWRVTVLSASPHKAEQLNKNIYHEVVKTNIWPNGSLGYSWILIRLCLKGLKLPRHDVVLTMTDPPLSVVAGRIISKSKKSRHVHWCQDLYPDLFPAMKIKMPMFIQNFLGRMATKAMQKCDNIIVIGECMTKKIIKKNINAEKVQFIPNWADFEVINPSQGSNFMRISNKMKAMAKKPEEMFRDDSPKFRVLYAGTIGKAHPMRCIVEAAEILAEHKEIEFVFVGDQHAHSSLAKERARRGLDNIKFMPFQPIEKLRQVMESGDLHLVTMREEAQGMLVPCKFYSGITVGRPTIFAGPRNSEIANVIENFSAGSVVSPNDGQALADIIYKYRHEGDVWFGAQEGALRAAQAYYPHHSLQMWVDLLERQEPK